MRSPSDCRILVVDDAEVNIDILLSILGDDYNISVAMDGESALELVQTSSPDLILLDIKMPGMDGYEVCRRLKADPWYRDIPIIFVTGLGDVEDEAKGLELGAIDYLTKPVSPPIVRARVKNHLELKLAKEELSDQNLTLEVMVMERTKELLLTREVTIECLASLAEYRDPETGGHIRRTQNYLRLLAENLRDRPAFRGLLDREVIDQLYVSAPLHDIGKVGIPDHILLKPDRLTNEEFEIMKKHADYGREAIMTAERRLGEESFLSYARLIAYGHHERWDGSGYPLGLKGEAIPFPARLMAVADVYDALISKRVYKAPMRHSRAVKIMEEGMGTHFDPEILSVFLDLQEDFRQVALEHADFQEETDALSAGFILQ